MAEAARAVEHPDTLDCILRGRAARAKPQSPRSSDEAIEWYEPALALDPASPEAQARLAVCLVSRVQDFIPESSKADIDRAYKLASQALMSSPRSALAHFAVADVLRTQRRYAEAISEYEAALALDRNFAHALADLGRCRTYIGPVDEAILAQQHAIRLRSPTHKPHPDSGGGKFDESEVVGVVLFEASCDGPEVFELVEEAFDEVAIAVKPRTESRDVHPVRHRLDVGPGATSRDSLTQGVTVVTSIRKQDLTFADGVE